MTNKAENSNTPLKPSLDISGVSGSDSKECKNCLYFNVKAIACKHPNWDKCIRRDDDEFVIDYVYHEYHYR